MLRVLITTDVLRFFMQDRRVFGSNPEMRRTKEGWDPPFFLAHEQHLLSRPKSIRSSVSGYAKICVLTGSFDASNEEPDSSKNLGDHHLAMAHADRPQCAFCAALGC